LTFLVGFVGLWRSLSWYCLLNWQAGLYMHLDAAEATTSWRLEVCRVHRRCESGSCPYRDYYIRVSNVSFQPSDSDGKGRYPFRNRSTSGARNLILI
jgi:hypothetical protein